VCTIGGTKAQRSGERGTQRERKARYSGRVTRMKPRDGTNTTATMMIMKPNGGGVSSRSLNGRGGAVRG